MKIFDHEHGNIASTLQLKESINLLQSTKFDFVTKPSFESQKVHKQQ